MEYLPHHYKKVQHDICLKGLNWKERKKPGTHKTSDKLSSTNNKQRIVKKELPTCVG